MLKIVLRTVLFIVIIFTISVIYFSTICIKTSQFNGLIEFIGDPTIRIKEDYLRILRYIRFFLDYSRSQHNKNTVKILKQNLKQQTINKLV